jgi:L-threonylcarbamoyladenylate synthase
MGPVRGRGPRGCGENRSDVLSAGAGLTFPAAPLTIPPGERTWSLRTRTLRIDPAAVDAGTVGEIASVLLRDGIMAYPTETFYGLGAAAFSAKAVSRVFKLKGRDPGKPVPVIASDLDMVGEIAGPLPPVFWTLAEEFWPGPLTLVLKASPALPDFLTGPGGSIAVRIPPVPWIRKLAYDVSQPLTATSANLSGQGETSDPAAVAAVFAGKIELIVDGGKTPGGAASTLLDLTSPEPRLLREGAVPAARIRAALGA